MAKPRLITGNLDITPREKCPLAGYSARRGVWDTISDPLEANILVFRLEDRLVVFISLDCLFVDDRLIDSIVDRFNPHPGLARDDIYCFASHTHFAPALDHTKPLLGEVSEAHYRLIQDALIGALEDAFDKPGEPFRSVYAETEVALNVCRRKRGWGFKKKILPVSQIRYAPDFTQSIDRQSRLLGFQSAQGRLLALMWNYACHPVGFYNLNAVSADFPGYIRRSLRQAHGGALPVLFLQGFSGEIDPLMIDGGAFKRFDKSRYEIWVHQMSHNITSQMLSLKPTVQEFGYASKSVRIALSDIVNKPRDLPALELRAVDLFGAATILAISAEVLSCFNLFARTLIRDPHLMTVGCLNSVYGYLPGRRALKEGGYEAGGFFKSVYDMRASFSTGAVDRVEQTISELLTGLRP